MQVRSGKVIYRNNFAFSFLAMLKHLMANGVIQSYESYVVPQWKIHYLGKLYGVFFICLRVP